MSLFSRSRSRGHYPQQNHGSDHYKRPGTGGGFLDKIMRLLTGSRSHSHSPDHFRPGQRQQHPRHKSWS